MIALLLAKDYLSIYNNEFVENETMMEDQPVITPRKNRGDPFIGRGSLMICLPSELKYLSTSYRARRVTLNDISLKTIYLVEQDGSAPISLCGPFLGAPHAVLVMEKLIALGARRLWMLGWCGSLNPELRVGDILLPVSSFSEEGTSNHYPIPLDRPILNKQLRDALQTGLENRHVKTFSGAVWSTDAPYRETKAKIKKYQELGALAVDMELSALATVAIYRDVQFAALLVVSDELFDYVWRPGFRDPRLGEQTRVASQVLFDVASDFERGQQS